MGVGEVAVGADGALEEDQRAGGVAALEQHVAEVVLGLGLVAIDLERVLVEPHRRRLVPAAERDVSEVRVGDGEGRIEIDRAAVERLGFVHRLRVFVERARARVELERGAHAVFPCPRPQHADDVGLEILHVEVEQHLATDGLERAFLRAHDDARAIGHDAQLGERASHARQRRPERGHRGGHVTRAHLASEEALHRAQDDQIAERVRALARELAGGRDYAGLVERAQLRRGHAGETGDLGRREQIGDRLGRRGGGRGAIVERRRLLRRADLSAVRTEDDMDDLADALLLLRHETS
jgi:hypothetical protein